MNRRGYVLPFVIVAVGASATLALAFITAAWRGHRAGRHGRQAEGVALATDQLLAESQVAWRRDSLWTRPPGVAITTNRVLADGVHTDITWRRSHPLVAWLQVEATRRSPIAEERASRTRWRAFWLQPPPLPLLAALTTSGSVTADGATTIDGIDTPLADLPCGLERETQSVVPVVAAHVGPAATAWPAMPAWQPAPISLDAQLADVLPAIASSSVTHPRDSLPSPLPVSPGWHAVLLEGPVVVIQGPTQWRGLLTVRGDLQLRGPVEIEGVLVVRGSLDASAATVRVRGAVLVADSVAVPVPLGSAMHIAYDRCAVQMALATVATPRSSPFRLWQAPAP